MIWVSLVTTPEFREHPKGGPHGVLWTHAEEVNSELVTFLE